MHNLIMSAMPYHNDEDRFCINLHVNENESILSLSEILRKEGLLD